MRFLWDLGDHLSIEEVSEIDITPSWSNSELVDEYKGIPETLSLTLGKGTYIAYKDINGSEKEYISFIQMYSAVVMKAFETGCCKASDFEEMEWF